MTLKFNVWPRKIKGHLFYTTSSFVYHFKSISEFKLKLHSGNAQFGSKSAIFCPLWPWNLMDDLEEQYGTSSMLLQALCIISQPSVNSNWSYSPETPNLGQIRQFLKPYDLEIWQMTLQNNRAPLQCYFKLCASFHTHWWIPIWVTVRKRSIRVTATIVWAVWPRNFTDDPQNNRASLLCYFKVCVSFRTHWRIQIGVAVRKRPIWVKFDDF